MRRKPEPVRAGFHSAGLQGVPDMIVNLTRDRLPGVKNRYLRTYAERYAEIYADFMARMAQTGIELDPSDLRAEIADRRKALREKGAISRNNGHSIYVGRLSPACVACQTGVGSATFYVSLKCHRNCFYCFNPNQEAYDLHTRSRRDVVAELKELAAGGLQVSHLAVTGGEPLLHPQETVAFCRAARERFPEAHTRLYTAGDHVDREILGRLQEAGLQEIRFSVRAHDGENGRRHTYRQIALAREFIPSVMVETPVLPGTLDIMKEMLRELDRLQVFGVNLLEFCFPFHNAAEFRQRGYRVKNPPYETLYDYWYAGGLPISRSELECLELLEFVIDERMSIGAHYCSLENKHTGQIYQQNWGERVPGTVVFSPRDYFFKAAKVFGRDISRVRAVLGRTGYRGYVLNKEHQYLEFNPMQISDLKELGVEIGICTYVAEERSQGPVLRELKIGLTTPQWFDPATDL